MKHPQREVSPTLFLRHEVSKIKKKKKKKTPTETNFETEMKVPSKYL
jgi:hypothetical protein